MKKIFSLFVAMFVMASFVSAQDINFSAYKSGQATDAKIAAEKEGASISQSGENATEWNYGSIKNASTGYRYFKFTNTGKAPLVISNAKGSCGCTVPEWPKEPIAPGAEGEIKVKFDSKGKKGKQSKTVTLTANTIPANTILTINSDVIKLDDDGKEAKEAAPTK